MDDEVGSVEDKSMGIMMQEEVIQEVLSLAKELGGDEKANKKAMVRRCRAIVSEIYSPPRVCASASKCAIWASTQEFHWT